MELAEVARRRRMVRSFSGSAPDRSTLEALLALARRAPSAGNTGGWDAVVLEGPSQTEVFWDATTTEEWRSRSRRWPGLRRAPVVVAFFSHPGAYLSRYAESDKSGSGLDAGPEAWPIPYWDVDTGMAALMLLLGAVDCGLGACFLGNFRGEAELRHALSVPAGRRYVGAVLIGEPDSDDHPTTSAARASRSPAEVFHHGRW